MRKWRVKYCKALIGSITDSEIGKSIKFNESANDTHYAPPPTPNIKEEMFPSPLLSTSYLQSDTESAQILLFLCIKSAESDVGKPWS